MTDGRDFCNDVAQSLLEFPSNFRVEEKRLQRRHQFSSFLLTSLLALASILSHPPNLCLSRQRSTFLCPQPSMLIFSSRIGVAIWVGCCFTLGIPQNSHHLRCNCTYILLVQSILTIFRGKNPFKFWVGVRVWWRRQHAGAELRGGRRARLRRLSPWLRQTQGTNLGRRTGLVWE